MCPTNQILDRRQPGTSGRIVWLLMWFLGSGLVPACSSPQDGRDASSAAGQSKPAPLHVLAAASTLDVLTSLGESFQELHGGQDQMPIEFVFEGTSTLAQQAMHGAPVDLFLSASSSWADKLELAMPARIVSRIDLLSNQLVIVTQHDNPLTLVDIRELAKDPAMRIAIADPDAVPAGIYARQALQSLGLWDQLQDQLVPGNNVRTALSYVETGAATLGIVYATDAAAAPGTRVLYRLESGLHDPVVYPLLLLQTDGQPAEGARMFFDFLRSNVAAEVFRQRGFTVLGQVE